MVQITDNGFTIEVETTLGATDQYLSLVQEMLDLLQSEDEHKRKERYYVIDLIKEMLPKDQNELKALCNQGCK